MTATGESTQGTVRMEEGPLCLITSEWIEVESDDPARIRENQLYLLIRAEIFRRFHQGETGRLLTFDFECMKTGQGGFTQEPLPDGKVKLAFTAYVVEERAGDSYMDGESRLQEFKLLQVGIPAHKVEQARAIHRVIRAMHDGECPKCHGLSASESMHRFDNDHSLTCPRCGFSVSEAEILQGLQLFAGQMERSLAVFEEWRKKGL